MTPLYVKIVMFVLSQGFFFVSWGRSNWLASSATGCMALASTVFLGKEIYEEFIAAPESEIIAESSDCAGPDADWSHAAQENTCYAIRAYLRRHGDSKCYAVELASGRRGGLCQAYDAEQARIAEEERRQEEQERQLVVEATRRWYGCRTDSGTQGVSFGQECWPLDTTQIKLTDIPSDVRGEITDASPLAGLTGLRVLWLDNTQVSDLTPLSGLTGVQGLHLVNTQVSALTPLSGLTGLQWLNMANTQVSDLTPLSGMTGLQELYFDNTEVSDLTPLSGMTGLQELYFDNTEVSDLTPLSGMTGLQRLSLWNLWNTQVSDLTPLSGVTGLHYLRTPNGVVAGGPSDTPENRAAVAEAIRTWRRR